MDNFNKEQILYCKYCGKQCKSLNSLKQHEIRCKENPNHIKCNGQHQPRKFNNLGRVWINNINENKFIKQEELDLYLKNGWIKGINSQLKEKIKKSHIGKSSGKCKDPQKELERKQKISNSMKGNKNWMFNKKHGNAKQGWYNKIHCDSTWELAFLVYYVEHNLNIKRCDIKYNFNWEDSIHKYIPDFITDEGIIEIKGRKSKKSLEKEKQFPNVKVIDEYLIKPYLDYVINKYGEEFWKILYENK